eukprot:gnl/MRDRNA2_/MRDRNA2_27368_c0_seq2.p1 gnl/MRDRNA2_/MRDRNA2_27368_c0~~gnl/MRDRNA2_/MRDRNA2_27368_c0_seq2.p1  ORF type:complete len:126 (+),score=32.29 gnl/MRDRNA2_/MRDRNA2_27368_c0_seq2:38-415(+)
MATNSISVPSGANDNEKPSTELSVSGNLLADKEAQLSDADLVCGVVQDSLDAPDIFAMDMQGIAASSRRNLHNFGACGKACCTGFKGKKPVASQGLQTPDEYGSQLMAKFGDKKAGGRKVGGRKR